MLHTTTSTRGMVVAPHHLAAESGLAVLREGGNAVEAMVAAAATIAVVYPHMNAIGGDAFWLVHVPGAEPIAIRACGPAARQADRALYASAGLDAIPTRGPLAANTVAGTVSGWARALELAVELGGTVPLARLLEDAIHYAADGTPMAKSFSALVEAKRSELEHVPGFAPVFMPDGRVPVPGERLRQPALAATLESLARDGLDGFYRGDLARRIGADLVRAGSPVDANDLAGYAAERVAPLSLSLDGVTLYNQPPPTQGVAALMILGVFARLGVDVADAFAHLHGLVESTKQAFLVRDREVTDPRWMRTDPAALLAPDALDHMAADVDMERALPWPQPSDPGDTIWMGAVDSAGRAVSFIQSVYWEFGSGVVLEDTGITWQNRGASFSLDANALNALEPGRLPFHTLNPALARFADGRVMPYGTMGGDGQPQTQAAVFSRYAWGGLDLQGAITAPRWLLGRTWGDATTTLKLESRFDPVFVEQLREAGHDIEIVGDFDDVMGHAGALVHRPDGVIEGASDPRSDGRAAGW